MTIDFSGAPHAWEKEKSNFVELLDLKLESVEHGKAVMRMPYRSEITNGTGAVHGGAIVSLCDTVFYVALGFDLRARSGYDDHRAAMQLSGAGQSAARSGCRSARVARRPPHRLRRSVRPQRNGHRRPCHARLSQYLLGGETATLGPSRRTVKEKDHMLRSLPILAVTVLVAGCASNAVPVSTAAASSLKSPLLYVADLGNSDVVVDSYPNGKTQFVLTGFGSTNGLCADLNGNVYVADGHNQDLVKYGYGSQKPGHTLSDPGYYLSGCSVDPNGGDIAVATQATNSNAGGVAIFRNGKGKAHNDTSTTIYFARSCAYDDKSNLYVDGTTVNGNFVLAELPAKSDRFTTITLDQSITAAGGVQWDARRKLVVVNDQGVGYQGSTIYEFSVSGSTGTKQGTTPLTGSSDVTGFALDESGSGRVIGTNTGSTPSVLYWKYPKGGNPTKTLTGFSQPVSVVIASQR